MNIEFRLARSPKWITKSMKIDSRQARAPNWSASRSGSSEDHEAVFRLQHLSASYASYASYASFECYNASLHVYNASSSNSQAQRLPKLTRIILKLILMWYFANGGHQPGSQNDRFLIRHFSETSKRSLNDFSNACV